MRADDRSSTTRLGEVLLLATTPGVEVSRPDDSETRRRYGSGWCAERGAKTERSWSKPVCRRLMSDHSGMRAAGLVLAVAVWL